MTRGSLVLVVGPSGAGKDTLIAGAKVALADRQDFRFPRRVITRPYDAGGEDHVAVSDQEFAGLSATGEFLLEWAAHDLRYGIPVSIREDITTGRTVVINVSRGVLSDARQHFEALRVIHVTAPTRVLASRLAERSREHAEAIQSRLARQVELPRDLDIIDFDNTAPLRDAIAAFTALLHAIADGVPRQVAD